MVQGSLFQVLDQLKAAIAADVEAAGGNKAVGIVLWPDVDPGKAAQKLSNATNAKQKQELDYHEIQKVKLLARKASGASHIHAYESKALECELHWITQQEKAERAVVKLGDAANAIKAAILAAQQVLSEIK